MARVTAPLMSKTATGTFAGAVIYQPPDLDNPPPTPIARCAPRLHFRTHQPAPLPTVAQLDQRSALAEAIAYAQAPPPDDAQIITAIATARSLPLFQAACAHWFATH
jgi:hypothetical protein